MTTPPFIPQFSAYRAMWLFVFFDLPVKTKKDRHLYRKFREGLEKDGFLMHQYSIYVRDCLSLEKAEVHVKRVQKAVPPKGQVSILTITDKQYGNIINIIGAESVALREAGKQLQIF